MTTKYCHLCPLAFTFANRPKFRARNLLDLPKWRRPIESRGRVKRRDLSAGSGRQENRGEFTRHSPRAPSLEWLRPDQTTAGATLLKCSVLCCTHVLYCGAPRRWLSSIERVQSAAEERSGPQEKKFCREQRDEHEFALSTSTRKQMHLYCRSRTGQTYNAYILLVHAHTFFEHSARFKRCIPCTNTQA